MDKFDVEYNGKHITRINARLAISRGLSDELLEYLKHLHCECYQLEQDIYNALGDTARVKIGLARWHEIQFHLQYVWGFKKDINYHRFWDMPGCTCPLMDNDDAYPTGNYVINMECPIHGN